MSGTLHIKFAPDMPGASVEVVAPDLTTVDRVWLGPGQERLVEVPSEGSFLRVHLASGKIVTLHDPGNLQRVVSMATLAERLERSRSIEPTSRRPRTLRDLRLSTYREMSASIGAPVSTVEAALEGNLRVRLVSADGGTHQGEVRELGTTVTFRPPHRMSPLDLVIEAPDSRFRVRVPGTLEELLVRSDVIEETRRLVTVRVRTVTSVADTLSAYMNRGDLHSAATMADWADKAEDLLEQKGLDPFAATVGAYLLLRLRRFDLMRSWPKNLADRFPAIPDGNIVWAWRNIHTRENEPEIRSYLRRAADNELPIFSEGLQLLSDGLRLLGNEMQPLIDDLNKRSGTVLWSSPFTATLHGNRLGPSEVIELDVDYAPQA